MRIATLTGESFPPIILIIKQCSKKHRFSDFNVVSIFATPSWNSCLKFVPVITKEEEFNAEIFTSISHTFALKLPQMIGDKCEANSRSVNLKADGELKEGHFHSSKKILDESVEGQVCFG